MRSRCTVPIIGRRYLHVGKVALTPSVATCLIVLEELK